MSEIISADCHLDFWYLPGDLFYSEAPASWKDVFFEGIHNLPGG